MKKILLLNYCYPGQGTYLRCYYFGAYLARAGYSVDLVCASAESWDMWIRRKRPLKNLSVITLPSPIRPGSPIAYLLRTAIGVLWVLTKKYDLIHAFGAALPSTGIPIIISRWFGKKAKIALDWDDAWGDAYGPMFGRLSHAAITFLENKTPLWARPDAFTVVGRYFKVRLLKMGVPMDKINILPNGCDTNIVKPMNREAARAKVKWDKDDLILLSMGHNYFDSLITLFEAFSRVLEKRPSAKLKMLGSLLKVSKHTTRTNAILKKYDYLNGRIEWVGEVPRKRVGEYLSAADCLLLPMENSLLDEARAPIRIGDYLASGRPVVSNAVGYSRELLASAEPNAVCDNPDSSDEFAEKVLAVLDNPKLAEEIGKSGLELAEGKQNWKNICADLIAVYEKLI